MKRASRRLHESFQYVKLYLDDIERMYEIISEEFDIYGFNVGEYILDDIQELNNLQITSTNTVNIDGRWKSVTDAQLDSMNHEERLNAIKNLEYVYLSVSTSKYGVSISVSSDDALARGVFERVKEIFDSRRSKLRYWLHSKFYLGGGLVVLSLIATSILTAMFKADKVPKLQANRYLVLILLLVAIGIIWLGFDLIDFSFRSKVKVILQRKLDQPGFIRRNRDQLVLGTIVAIITIILTLIAEAMVSRLFL